MHTSASSWFHLELRPSVGWNYLTRSCHPCPCRFIQRYYPMRKWMVSFHATRPRKSLLANDSFYHLPCFFGACGSTTDIRSDFNQQIFLSKPRTLMASKITGSVWQYMWSYLYVYMLSSSSVLQDDWRRNSHLYLFKWCSIKLLKPEFAILRFWTTFKIFYLRGIHFSHCYNLSKNTL